MYRSALMTAPLALLLSACVTVSPPEVPKGRYTNFREMAYSRMQLISWKNLPEGPTNDLRTCMVDALYAQYTPDEIKRLDAYARGENQLSTDEFNKIEAAVNERVGGKPGMKAALKATCPETWKTAQGYGVVDP